MRFALTLTACLLTVGGAAVAQGITTHPVVGGIYMLEGRGGNIGVSTGEDGLLIIDTQYANMAEPILAALKNLQDGPLEFVVNTHWHADHTGGNIPLAQGTPVVAQENVRVRMANKKDLSDDTLRNSLPWVTFDDDLSLHFNGEEIHIVHYPTGHTDGDSIVHFTKSNVFHLGDHFFNGAFPFIDLSSGGDVEGYLKNVGEMLTMIPHDAVIIPGHGPLGTRADLQKWYENIRESVELIRDGIDTGRNKKALLEAGLPDKFAGYSAGFVSERRWISIVYQSLTR